MRIINYKFNVITKNKILEEDKMILLTNCNIKGLVTPYKNLGDFASDLEQLFKKHHIE